MDTLDVEAIDACGWQNHCTSILTDSGSGKGERKASTGSTETIVANPITAHSPTTASATAKATLCFGFTVHLIRLG